MPPKTRNRWRENPTLQRIDLAVASDGRLGGASEAEAEGAEERCARAEAEARVSPARRLPGWFSRPSVAGVAPLKGSQEMGSNEERGVRENRSWVETPSCCCGVRISKLDIFSLFNFSSILKNDMKSYLHKNERFCIRRPK